MKIIIAVTALSLLVACGPTLTEKSTFAPSEAQLTAAKTAAAYDLKDPGSAQFRKIRGIQATAETGGKTGSVSYICGEVNARNSFGGYVGFTPFVYIIKNGTVVVADRSDGRVNMFDQAEFDQYC